MTWNRATPGFTKAIDRHRRNFKTARPVAPERVQYDTSGHDTKLSSTTNQASATATVSPRSCATWSTDTLSLNSSRRMRFIPSRRRRGCRVPSQWSAAMRHAHPATTNNQAEYQGLITSLRTAHQNKWFPLEVVSSWGQRALLQLRSYRQPKNLCLGYRRSSACNTIYLTFIIIIKNLCLLRLYAIARRLADLLDVRRWMDARIERQLC